MQLVYKAFDSLRDRARRRTWDPDLARGRRGEDLAHRYLQKRGFTIVARNFRTRSGSAEVDLIGWDGPRLVFIEVKSRSSEAYGAPDRAVDRDKQRKIIVAAGEYLHRIDAQWEIARFDVVNVILGDTPAIRHIEDAFSRVREY